MLVLSRKRNEVVWIGDDIWITVVSVEAGKVRLGFNAPDEVKIRRGELKEKQAATEIWQRLREKRGEA